MVTGSSSKVERKLVSPDGGGERDRDSDDTRRGAMTGLR